MNVTEGPFVMPDGWTVTRSVRVTHGCGWQQVVAEDEPWRVREAMAAHACPWPEPPEPVETPDG